MQLANEAGTGGELAQVEVMQDVNAAVTVQRVLVESAILWIAWAMPAGREMARIAVGTDRMDVLEAVVAVEKRVTTNSGHGVVKHWVA